MKRAIRELTSFLHDGTLQNLVAVHLQACSLVNDDEEFISISIGEPNEEGIRPIIYQIIKHKEAELIIHS